MRTLYICQQSTIEWLHYTYDVDFKTLGKLYSYIRKAISIHVQENYMQPIGSEFILEYSLDRLRLDRLPPEEIDNYTHYSPAVEIDETLLTHFKNIDGKTNSQCWAIGIFDRSTHKIIVKAVGKHRNEETIRQIVKSYVENDELYPTRVYTDHFKAYNFLVHEGYKHIKINHSKGYGQGATTTNHIENFWSQLKNMSLFDSGFNTNDIELVQQRIDEGVWRISQKQQKYDLAVELAQILGSNNNPIQENYQ